MLEFYKGKKVFITGHTGFKGSWLCKILLLAGADVCGYSLEPNTEPNMFNLLGLENQMKSFIGDIRDFNNLKTVVNNFQPEIFFHLAAQPIVRESYTDPVYTFDVNIMGTVNVLETVRQCASIKSFVNITTDKVYMNKEWEWGYRENERLCGYDPYSNSKSCSELVTYSYKKSFFDENENISVSTARSGNVIGGGDFAKDRIVPDCIRAAIKNEDIVVRNPYSTRPYQHVLDCLNGYLTLAQLQFENRELSGNYNFGPDDESCITTGQLADLFCKTWTNVNWINKSIDGPHEANFLKLDCSRAKKILKWYPKLDINEAVAYTVEWTKEFVKEKDLNIITNKQIKRFFGDEENEK